MDIKNKINAFSLIELIVGITISMMLMVSIGVFVNSGMKNIFLQQKSLEFSSNLNDFSNNIYETFSSIENSGSINLSSSGIIFKRIGKYSDGGFSYVGISELNNYFCEDINSENTNTNHIFIKNFIPFFESGENINTNNYLTGTILHNGNTYISYQKEHKITDSSGNIIVGKGIFGDFFENGLSGTGIYLNSPTGMASDSEVIYISDTLNNRILYLSGSTIHKLLDENDGIVEPTGLYYDTTDDALYVSNSGLGEIWKITSEDVTKPNINLSFSGVTENNIDTIYLEFFKDKIPYNIVDLDIDTSSFNDDNNDNKDINNNVFSYSFMSGSISETKDFIGTNTYNIGLTNLFNFDTNGIYTIKLIIGNSEKEFYYFSKGDEKIYTMKDNKIEIIRTGLNYPNGIWGIGATDYNQFDISTIGNLSPDSNYDNILKNPIYNLDISRNGGGSGNLLNIIIKHYKNYNCYNLDENKEKISTFLSKFILK